MYGEVILLITDGKVITDYTKIKNESAVGLIRGSFVTGNTGLALFQTNGC